MVNVTQNQCFNMINRIKGIQGESPQKEKRSFKKEEWILQCACHGWFNMQYPKYRDYFMASVGGGSRGGKKVVTNKKTGVSKEICMEGANLQKSGYKAGTPDIRIAVVNDFYAGLEIEMKVKGGTIQPSQKRYNELLNKMGYKAVICWSSTEFEQIVNEYMKTARKI